MVDMSDVGACERARTDLENSGALPLTVPFNAFSMKVRAAALSLLW
jgi:hypothetical protein